MNPVSSETVLPPANVIPSMREYAMERDYTDDAEGLRRVIENGAIVPHFQPIVDLFLGEVHGYEVLSRGPEPFVSPLKMFGLAEDSGQLWELEFACRSAAFRRIATFRGVSKHRRFFVNVSPQVFSDPRFRSGLTLATLMSLGLDQRDIVMEITEAHSVEDYEDFERVTHHYVDQGFHIALDDFGAGHSSLVTLVAAAPQYVKLDRAIISNINSDSYKQQLVKSMISFASAVETKLIAEGIETEAELEFLLRLGVRYGQGFYFARPERDLVTIEPDVKDHLRGLVRRFQYPEAGLSKSISSMVLRPPVYDLSSVRCQDLDSQFRRNSALDHVVVVDDGCPIGLVARQHFYSLASGRFGFSLVQNKYIEDVAKPDALVVEETMDITVLGKLAMNRQQEDLYDPVIVTDKDGYLVGTITMKQLLTQSIKLEVQAATSANPLTGLPGNRMIDAWLREILGESSFWVIYADLDRFKEYNDCYGFPMGDEMIKLAAAVLRDCVPLLSSHTRLGHVGGDDYIAVSKEPISTEALDRICDEFDTRKKELFAAQDAQQGYYMAVDRQGNQVEVPLVTLSIAIVSHHNVPDTPYIGQLGQIAASLKKKVKALNARNGRSGYLMDRRAAQTNAYLAPRLDES